MSIAATIPRAEIAIQDDAVENTSHFVGDRLVHVATGDEHGVKRGDRSAGVSLRSSRRGKVENTDGG